MMDLFTFAVVAPAGLLLLAIPALVARSRLSWLVPAGLLLSMFAGYAGLNAYLGQPRPVGSVIGWSGPQLGDDGAVVLGGTFDSKTVTLLIGEPGHDTPRAFAFRADPAFVAKLKLAMAKHAVDHSGEHWGFLLKAPKPESQEQGQGSGSGGGSGRGSASGDAGGFVMEEPHPKTLPPKDRPAVKDLAR